MKTLGILGGMGPVASAEFLRTIYALNITDPEQNAPNCILLSDPTFPDRSKAIEDGSTGELLIRLCESLELLSAVGSNRIVIACVTIHQVLPAVPESLRRKVISLIDLVIEQLVASPQKYLLLTTTGTRTAGIFEHHDRWREVSPWVLRPDREEQLELHERIYLLKKGMHDEDFLVWLEGLATRHSVEGLVFGCTELHLLHRSLDLRRDQSFGIRIVDPLLIVARDLKTLIEQ